MIELSPPYEYRREMLAPASIAVADWQDELRKRRGGVAIAEACVGAHADKAAEAALLLAHDPPKAALRYLGAGKSTCGLLGRAYLELAGAEHDYLDAAYLPRDGRAISDVVAVARAGGAWRTPTPAVEPGPGRGATPAVMPRHGDVILIGHADEKGRPDPAYVRGTSATEHMLIVRATDDRTIDSVDGGQPGIELRTRRIEWVGRELWLAHTAHGNGPDGRPLVGRRVVGWLDIAALPLPREAYLPIDADIATV